MEEATLWQVVRATAKVSCVSAGSSSQRDQMVEDLVSAPPLPKTLLEACQCLAGPC